MSAPAGAAPVWSVVPAVAGAPYGRLASVWCAGPARCFAVGAADTPLTSTKLAERWTGTSWTVTPSPSPSPSTSSQFTSVHCVTSTNCVAVGQYAYGLSTRPLVERWNGTKWSLVPSPRPAGVAVSGLTGVWCASSTFCVAVGSYFVSTEDSLATSTLVERWNGNNWSIVTSPNPANNSESELSGIACPGPNSCFAVGSGRGTLVERWNGTSWSIMTSPNPIGATGASLTSVSCPSLTRCYAVSDFFTGLNVQRLVERWNGTSWAIVDTPLPAGTVRSSLGGVSCATTANCFAVGEYRLGPSRRPLILHLL